MKKILLIAILAISSTTIFAQDAAWCGTEISDEWMQSFYNRNKDHLTHKATALDEVVIPITYHIVGEDDGSGYYSLAELFRSHCELQELYTNANITFYIESINYIDDSDNYEVDNTYEVYDLFRDYNNDNTCNVFIINSMSGVCGFSFVPENHDGSGYSGPNNGGVMLQQGCMEAGNTTYRHEMGHYLNLPHTFYGWEGEDAPDNNTNAPEYIEITGANTSTPDTVFTEKVDRSNCLYSGDGFCDTPPDYLSDRWTCTTPRTYLDPDGVSFEIDEKNYMSYSNDGCSSYLKDDQLAEVNAAPANYRPYLLNLPIPTFDNLEVITDMVPTNNSRNINPNNIIISWPRQANADYYHIQITRYNFTNPTIDEVITDTFYVIQNPVFDSEYKYQVKPISLTNVCTDFSEVQTFTTASFDANFTITELNCPNDYTGSANVLVNSVTGSYSYYWFDDINASSLIANQSSNTIDYLNSGEYSLIVVKNNFDTLFIPFIVPAPEEITVEIYQVGTTLEAEISGGNPPYTYIWGNNEEDLVLTNPSEGENTFLVIDQNGCQLFTSGVYDKNMVGINDINSSISSLNLIPNPINTNQLKINFDALNADEVTVLCSDISGKTLLKNNYTTVVGENNFNVNVSSLSNGVYFVTVIQNGLKNTAKLVVNK